jgi:hypothetical protein
MFAKQSLAILAAMGVTGAAYAGWQFTTVNTTEGKTPNEKGPATVKMWAQGNAAKIETVDGAIAGMKTGAYMVTKDGGNTMFVVDPDKKTYMKWDMEGMMNMAGGAMKMMNMKFSNLKTEKLLEEAGETIEGFPTRHYRFRTSYDMEMAFMGMKQVSSVVQEQDIWATAKLTDAGMYAWFKKQAFNTGNEDLDKLIKAEREKVKGLALKTITKTTTSDSHGKERVSTSTSLVTDIKETALSPALFEIPSDYTETSVALPSETGSSGEGEKSAPAGSPLLNLLKRRLGDR